MLISIVISTLNRSATVNQCLKLLNAEIDNCKYMEVLLVDDGSSKEESNNLQNICRDLNTKYIRHEYNRGMAVGRNTGIINSSGEWVVFLDDDIAVTKGWVAKLVDIVNTASGQVVAFEGRVEPSGNGVWDREVQNSKGGLYLTCHMVYRRSVLDRVGLFDPQFEFEGPYAEDQELAIRVLSWGEVQFRPDLVVTHTPRNVNLLRYIRTGPKRICQLLNAEYYFYLKHPEHYHRFRHARTFWGTLRNVLLRHTYGELRRRSTAVLLKHPLQTSILLISSIIEQVVACVCAIHIVKRRWFNPGVFARVIDNERTVEVWSKITNKTIRPGYISKLKIHRSLFNLITFKWFRKPVYNCTRIFSRVKNNNQNFKILVRIDDMFFEDAEYIQRMCSIFKKYEIPFLGSVIGRDLLSDAKEECCRTIIDAKGTIALHGFEHVGKYGPYASEILQMRFTELERNVKTYIDILDEMGIEPKVFVAPFNGIGREQILFLHKYFDIVTGGPETMRFTEQYFGPLIMKSGGWYIPSLYPFYNSAKKFNKLKISNQIKRMTGMGSITFHLQEEMKDDFAGFEQCIKSIAQYVHPWSYLTELNSLPKENRIERSVI